MKNDRTRPPATRAGTRSDELFDEFSASRDAELREQLFRQHLPLARKMALRYVRRGEPDDDLLQVASIGLLNAIDRYSPERGVAFTTFAVPCILGELRRHFRDHTWAVHVPRRLKDLRVRVDMTRTEMTSTLGREPTVEEIARTLGESLETILDVIAANAANHPAPFVSGTEDDASQGAVLAVDDDGFAQAEHRAVLDPLLATLSPIDRQVLALRFGGDMTQTQIAELLGISQMQVSRRLTRVIRHLNGLAYPDA